MDIERLQEIEFFKNIDMQYAFDSLTHVLNRGTIMSYFTYLIEEKRPFTICISDIDNFKLVNDNYGHLTGDKVLKLMADDIVKSVGENGVVGRYGGDEFIIIFEGLTEYNEVWSICHNVNKSVSRLELLDYANLHVTLTTGVSRYPNDGATYEELLNTADKALYRGKSKGRNCFIIYLHEKHAGIVVESNKEKKYTSMIILTKLFSILNDEKPLHKNVKFLFSYLSKYLDVGHICLESRTKMGISTVNDLSRNKEFRYIDTYEYEGNINSIGLFYLNQRAELLQNGNQSLHAKLKAQAIISSLAVKVDYNNIDYGYIRVDSCSNRVWQTADMDIFVVAAKLLGTLLFIHKLTIDDLIEAEEE